MPLQNYILSNFKWKVLSLVLAALAWLTIHPKLLRDQAAQQSPVVTSVSQTRKLSMPIRLIIGPDDTNHFRLRPDTVSLEIAGRPEDLSRLEFGEIQANVDVSDPTEEKQFRKPVLVRVPRDVSVNLVNPSNVVVERITASSLR